MKRVTKKQLTELFFQVDEVEKAIPDDTDPLTAYDKGIYYGAGLVLSYLLGYTTESQWHKFLSREHNDSSHT